MADARLSDAPPDQCQLHVDDFTTGKIVATGLMVVSGLLAWLGPEMAQASVTNVTDSTGTLTAAATTIFGSWDSILTSNIVPLAALAGAVGAVVGGLANQSSGLVVGAIIGIFVALLVAALPGVVTESAGAASLGLFAPRYGVGLPPSTVLVAASYAGVHYGRRLCRR